MKNKVLISEDLAMFSSQMALSIKTGIPISESIMILIEDSSTKEEKTLLKAILEPLEMGETLASALRATHSFPDYYTQMVEIGEQSGRLDDVLDSLYRYYTREYTISQSIRSAVTYPAIMLCVLVVIVMVLVLKVLPIFNNVLASLGIEMNGFALAAMNVGNIISRYSIILIFIIAAIALIILILRLTSGGKNFLKKMGNILFKKLSTKMAQSKFASAMSLMIASGLDIDKSVELTIPMIDNSEMHKRVEFLKKKIDDGDSFTATVVETKVFSGMEARMLTLGFKAGSFDTVMNQIADNYQDDVDERLDSLISIIEPTMVAVLCIIVGLILLSAMLPLLGLMTSML